MKKYILILVGFILGLNSSYSQELVITNRGISDYFIIIPQNPPEIDVRAAETLRTYLQKSTGADLPVITDDETPKSKEILIGNNRHLKELNIDINVKELEEDGFRILTSGEHLVFVGGSENGILYSVYSFLEDYLDCRMYSSKVQIVPQFKKLVIPQIDITEVPVIKTRMLHYQDAYTPEYNEWHKLDNPGKEFKDWGMWVHTFDDLVPSDEYFQEHPEYFTEINGLRTPKGQLCLTNPDVLKLVIDNLGQMIEEKPDATYWSVSQNDNYLYCRCEDCEAMDEIHGSHSGTVINFVNKVAKQFPDKTISTLAYQYSRSAPKDLIPADNVQIVLCSIECNRSKPISVDTSSVSFKRDIEEWGKITNNILVWDYTVQFRNLVSPFPNFRVLQPNIQFFVDNNAFEMFQQGNGAKKGEFAELRAYIIAKLLWDPDADVEAIMNDFLDGYYGKSAKYIKEYITTMHDALEASGETLLIYGNPVMPRNGYLSPTLISNYNNLFDKAEKRAKRSPEVVKRVKEARLPLQFAILEQARYFGTGAQGYFYQNVDSVWEPKPEMKNLLSAFVDGCQEAGIEKLEEHGTSPEEYDQQIQELWAKSMPDNLALLRPVRLKIDFSPKYDAGGAQALTDGIRGLNDYNMNWLGFEGSNMDAIIDLGDTLRVNSVSIDFLQDINSWVFLPKAIKVYTSINGNVYKRKGGTINKASEDQDAKFIETFEVELDNVKTRYVRIKTAGHIFCPDWHKGAGKMSWIFADEIIVR